MISSRFFIPLAFIGAVLCVSNADVRGQNRQNDRTPVIVVYNQSSFLDGYAADYRPGNREAADPPAWGYLNRGVLGKTQRLERGNGFQADRVFSHAIRGFSASLTEKQMADLRLDPDVDYIELDADVEIVAQTTPWGIIQIGADQSTTKSGDGSGDVTNVNVYVIDTGVDAGHTDLNAVNVVNFAGGKSDDCNGHGTHVAGTIAAKDNTSDVVGVVPGAQIYAVKVLNCAGSGTMSGVTKGVDWVTANGRQSVTGKPAVANMSLGGPTNTALDTAVKNSAAAGITYALAAGNSGANACDSSPARAGTTNGVITVAATDSADKEASWSNYGSCVDIWGPGVNILSTRKGGGTTTMSGTSMASPHVAGAAALYRSTHIADTFTAADVESALKGNTKTPGTASKSGAPIKLLSVLGF